MRAELGYADAHIGAALLFGANTADIGSVMRVGSLCRSLQQHGRAIRAELTASQVRATLRVNIHSLQIQELDGRSLYMVLLHMSLTKSLYTCRGGSVTELNECA